MLSQVRNLRHTIMAIVTIASLMGVAPYSALAAPIPFNFTITVGGGGTVTGSFSVKDDDNNGIIDDTHGTIGIIEVLDTDANGTNDVIELTALTAKWSGPSPAGFTLSIPSLDIPDFDDINLVQFEYKIAANEITNLLLSVAGGSILISCGPPDPMDLDTNMCGPGGVIGITGPDSTSPFDITDQLVMPAAPAAVPEPSTAILLSLGLVGMLLYAFSRRVRPVAPQRVPVADATR